MDSVSRCGLPATSAAATVLPLAALAQAPGALLKGDIETWAGAIPTASIEAP